MLAVSAWAASSAAGAARADELGLFTVQGMPDAPAPEAFGLPEGTPLRQGRYILAYDGRTRCPRWVMEYLDRSIVGVSGTERPDGFDEDERIPIEFRATNADYKGSGKHRGHMGAAGNFENAEDKAATFLLSNIAPQDGGLNVGLWRRIETEVRGYTWDARIWVCTMPLFMPAKGVVRYEVIGVHSVAVPTHFAKAVLIRRPAQDIELRAWIVPNGPVDGETSRYRVSVDEIEIAAGLDLFGGLPDGLEKRLEAKQP